MMPDITLYDDTSEIAEWAGMSDNEEKEKPPQLFEKIIMPEKVTLAGQLGKNLSSFDFKHVKRLYLDEASMFDFLHFG